MTIARKVRVLVADDHAPTRGDVREALEEDGRFEVCAEVADAPAAIEAALREQPDVCVLDVRMPGSGVAVVRELGARLPGTKAVMLTVSAEDGDVLAAVRAGASGYLLKDMDLDELPQALLDVLNGRAAIPGALMTRVLEELRDRTPRRRSTAVAPVGAEALTSREWQVLDLLRLDLGTAEIARRLHLSQATVRSHIARIVRKLGVADRDAAVALFRPER